MTAQQFETRFLNHFNGVIKNTQQRIGNEIKGKKERLPGDLFLKWLNDELIRLSETPELRTYDITMSKSMDTPAKAAETIRQLIQTTYKVEGIDLEDWSEHWTMVAHITTNFKSDTAANWKFYNAVKTYNEAIKANTASKVFRFWIESATYQSTIDLTAPRGTFDIDVKAIVYQTLLNYPNCFHKKTVFENLLQVHLSELIDYYEESERIGGLDEMRADYERVYNSQKKNYMATNWNKTNAFNGVTVDELKAEKEIEIQFFKIAFEVLDSITKSELDSGLIEKKDTKKQNTRTFDQLFTDKMKVINALVRLNLIVPNASMKFGYEWVYDDPEKGKVKGHGIKAMWEAAKSNNLVKRNMLKNKPLSVEAIRVFFDFETLYKGVFDENTASDKYHSLLKSLKKEMA